MTTVISIVGGGWSFAKVDHKKVPGMVIAVNDTLIHFRSKLEFVVSMDRLWTENRWYALESRCIDTYLRRSSLKHIEALKLPNAHHREWLKTFENERMNTTFSEFVTQLNGRNSGACALNLAYTIRPKTIYLFGFDMCRSTQGKAYWYPGYDWVGKGDKGGTGQRTYQEWASDFVHYADQFRVAGIDVVNVSPASLITSFKKISSEDLGCAL